MKTKVKTLWDKIFYTPQPLPPQMVHSIVEIDGKPNRLHLRIEENGEGLLILNASTILHLNPTAAEIAYYLIKHMDQSAIVEQICKRYQINADVAREDIEDLKTRIDTLMRTPDLDPETFLDMERAPRHSTGSGIPLRLDCALTYQTPTEFSDLYSPVKRVDRTLDTEEWQLILKKCWEWGIPHVVFTGGEPTLRPDLIELIQFAENQGQVTGLITDGYRLTNRDYLHSLLQSGLDHIMLVFHPFEEESLEAIRDIVNEDIHLTVHLVINQNTKDHLNDLMDQIAKIGVMNLSLSAINKEFEKYLSEASRLSAEKGFSLVYDLPVPYSEINPVNLEIEEDTNHFQGAGRSWLYVEPDGDVLPSQGGTHYLGNLLKDSWMTISANRKLYLQA